MIWKSASRLAHGILRCSWLRIDPAATLRGKRIQTANQSAVYHGEQGISRALSQREDHRHDHAGVSQPHARLFFPHSLTRTRLPPLCGSIRERFENALRVDESLSPFLAIVRALSLFWRDLARLRQPPALARWRLTARERQTACLLSFRSISDASWIAVSQRIRSGEPCNDRWNERQRCLCKVGIMEKV